MRRFPSFTICLPRSEDIKKDKLLILSFYLPVFKIMSWFAIIPLKWPIRLGCVCVYIMIFWIPSNVNTINSSIYCNYSYWSSDCSIFSQWELLQISFFSTWNSKKFKAHFVYISCPRPGIKPFHQGALTAFRNIKGTWKPQSGTRGAPWDWLGHFQSLLKVKRTTKFLK